MKLESVALEDFRLRLPAGQSRRAFDLWWHGISSATKKTITPPKLTRVADGYKVEYFSYGEGKLYGMRLTLHADGTVGDRQSKILVGASQRPSLATN
jgi:hypothetical protein